MKHNSLILLLIIGSLFLTCTCNIDLRLNL